MQDLFLTMTNGMQFIADPALRVLLYLATIGTCGSVFLLVSTNAPEGSETHKLLIKQIKIALPLLIIVELLRFAVVMLSFSGWEMVEAFSSDMMSLATQIAPTKAIFLRVVGGILLFVSLFTLKLKYLAVLSALFILSGFLIEGHTASSEVEGIKFWVMKLALGIHLVVFHWWLAVLWPLYALARLRSAETANTTHQFGIQATFAVPLLLVAGFVLFAILTNWKFPNLPDFSSPYQQAFILKMVLVLGILAIAALNKLRHTPALQSGTIEGFSAFQKSVKIEIVCAVAILLATAVAIFIGLMS